MRFKLLPLVLATLLAGCPGQQPTAPKASPRNVAASTATSVLAATSAPDKLLSTGIDAERRQALVATLHATVAAGRVSTVTGAVSDASSLIGNNGSSVIANNGGGIIANNGGTIISDHATGLTSKVKRQVLAMADVAIVPPPQIVKTDALVYAITIESVAKGSYASYDRKGYDSLPEDRRQEALIEYYVWDDMTLGPTDDPDIMVLDYTLKVVSSKRSMEVKEIKTKQLLKPDVAKSMANSRFTFETMGWEMAYHFNVGLLDGQEERADFVCTAGKDDLAEVKEGDELGVATPRRLTLTGHDSRGTYAGTIDQREVIVVHMEHRTPDGQVSTKDIELQPDGRKHQVTTSSKARLRLVADGEADGQGQGTVEDTDSGKAVGTVVWDAQGVATIHYEDGQEDRARLF